MSGAELYAACEHPLAAAQLACVMAAMGAKLAPRDFAAVAKRPAGFAWGLCCQFMVSPALAYAAVWLGGLPAPAALGLALVAAMPGGPTSTLLTLWGRGNAALAVALTATSTLLAPLATPWALRGFTPAGALALPMGRIAAEIVVFLLVPLFGGMLAARLRPAWRPTLATWGVRVGTTLLLTIVAGSLLSGRIRPLAHGVALPATIILFCVACQQAAMLPFRLFGWPAADRLAVGTEMTIRDLNLALLLKAALIPAAAGGGDDLALYAILFYGGTSLVAASAVAGAFRYLQPAGGTGAGPGTAQ